MWPIIAIAAIVVVIGLYVILTYNGLVGKRNRVGNAWSQIDVQLKRRHDLVPNLVNSVKGFMEHEREVLERVTTARAQAIAAGGNVGERAAAENALSAGLRSLFAVAEAYPQLRSNENMLALQEELASTENRIAYARQFYNDAVLEYNTSRETFPANMVAGPFGFAASTMFELADPAAERATPVVQF